MKIILSTLTALCMLIGNRALDAAPYIVQTEISPVNGHTYHLISPSNWTDAEAFAVSIGGHLATIRSQDENDWIVNTFGNPDTRYLWIGLNDEEVEGTFAWTSNEPVTYTDWRPGEPNNADGLEDHVEIGYSSNSFLWNDLYDLPSWREHDLQGVVEIIAVPEVPVMLQCAVIVLITVVFRYRRFLRGSLSAGSST